MDNRTPKLTAESRRLALDLALETAQTNNAAHRLEFLGRLSNFQT